MDARRIITFGTFDLFHLGHLRILERARHLGAELWVGVSSDELNFRKKNIYPVYGQRERMEIVRAIRCVDHVFIEEDMELKRQYITDSQADVLVMGNDWKGKFDDLSDLCEVIYLQRTPNVSTTLVKAEVFRSAAGAHARNPNKKVPPCR